MKTPLEQGAPIDADRMQSWLTEFAGYRTGATEGRIERWMQQFDDCDQDIAARLLDAVELIGFEQIDNSFKGILDSLSGWGRTNATRDGQWRFVAFSGSTGESGDSMLHRFRIANGLTSQKYDSLFAHRSELPKAKLKHGDTVVFVDDFSGSGQQACGFGPTLELLLPDKPRTILALVGATRQARERITRDTGLIVSSHFELTAPDNLFEDACGHFTPEEKERVLTYCVQADATYPRGRGDCGLLLTFAHNTPNNAIPILHVNKRQWRGLFPRHY